MYLVDISNFIDWFVNTMISGVTSCFDILDSISFHGLSLLDFSLAFVLIPVGVSILIAIHSSGKMVASYERRQARSKSGKEH